MTSANVPGATSLLTAVFETARDAILIADGEGRYVDGNAAALALLGVTRDQLLAMSLADVTPPEAGEAARATWRAFLRDGHLEGEFELRRPDGQRRVVEYRATANVLPDRHVSLMRDVTERREVEARLAVTDRMASLGMLAAGVAHEINNPLAAIVANLDLVATDPALAPELREPLADARAAAARVREIVADLKMFARADDTPPAPIDVIEVVESTLRIAWNEIRHRARLVRDLAEVPPVSGNASRLGQVVLNLVVNAAEAITAGDAGGHEIRVRTGVDAAGRVVLEVHDTGAGIAPEHLGRLFEPFFTTKPASGTGLGLPICQRIVHEMGGAITAASSGRGAVFRVTLPAAPRAGRAPTADRRPAPDPTRRGRVLVIDDEPMIGKAVQRSLGADHDVVVLTSAVAALDLLATGARFDVILCDLMMPQLTGIDFYRRLAATAPADAERIVFLTGGAFTPGSQAFLDRVRNLRVDKPFSLAALRAIVAERIT